MASGSLERARDPARMRAEEASARYAPAEPRGLGILAVLAMLGLLALLLPVGSGVLVGALLALALYRPYCRLARRTRKPALVALATTAVASVTVGGTLGVLVYVVALQGLAVASALPQSFAPGGAATAIVDRLSRPLAALNLGPDVIGARLKGALGGVVTAFAGWAAQAVGAVFDAVLALLFMAATMYFVLRYWTAITRHVERLAPINPRHTRRLMREVRRVGYTVVVGNVGTAVLQGLLAGAGYAIARVPHPAFFAAMTAVASLLPVLGTPLVWLPAGGFLLMGGHVGAGVFELAWGSVAVVGLCDYVVRPKLVGRGAATSTWPSLVALFGGIKLFGAVGLLLGPLIVGVALAVLRLYERTRRFHLVADRF
jgi:predicted PurR-regulated permease PerM